MKKVISLALAAIMCFALSATVFAADVDFTIPKDQVVHVSNDEVRPGITCGTDNANIETPTVAAGTKEVTFWGWIAVKKDVKSISYTLNNGEKVTQPEFKVAPEGPVVDAAKAHGAEFSSRFQVVVPVNEGTQLVKLSVNFVDDTSELFWIAELTVGEATEYDPNAGAAKDPETGKISIDLSKLSSAVEWAPGGYADKKVLNFENGASNANSSNYPHTIGEIDLSKYKSIIISYGTDASAVQNGVGDLILFNASGEELARVTLTGSEGWTNLATATIDVSKVDYSGECKLGIGPLRNGFVVPVVELEPADVTPAPTGDISMIFVIAAAVVVLTVIAKKKVMA